MYKRTITPLIKDKPVLRNLSNNQKNVKDVKIVAPTKQVIIRNPSNSKIIFSNQNTYMPTQGANPESPDPRRESSRVLQITDEMRKVVVQWLLQISHRANLRRETVFMGVQLFDTIIDKLKNLPIYNIQLVATTALFIAAKYEEIYPENLHRFLQYTANSYGKQELLLMQEKILAEMQFKLTFPTRMSHFGMIQESQQNNQNIGPLPKKYICLCTFLLEMSLLVRWEDATDQELAETISFLAKKVMKIATGWTSDSVLQLAYKFMGVWRENQKGVLAFLYDNEKFCYVGGMKILY